MSRSALTRHEVQQALSSRSYGYNAQVEDEVDEDGRKIKENELPIWGNDHTYNLNTLLYQNIIQSSYFRELFALKTYHEVVDEVYNRVDHAEPLSPGTSRIPSTCFCLLLKFCTMRLTMKQMQGLLNHMDSPYIRAVGFLYLRYTMDPENLWKWYEPYLNDAEEFNSSANPNIITTIGEWLRGLLEDINYFGTILPRIPKKIQDGIKVKLLLHDKKKIRAKENASIVKYLIPGTKIKALYADEDNEPAMYDAVIDSVAGDDEFWVTFPGYGNSEKVGLGDIEYTHASRGKGKYSRSRSPSSTPSSSRRNRRDDKYSRRSHRPRSRSPRRSSRRSRSTSRRRSRSTSRRRSQSTSRRRSRSRSTSRHQSRIHCFSIKRKAYDEVRFHNACP